MTISYTPPSNIFRGGDLLLEMKTLCYPGGILPRTPSVEAVDGDRGNTEDSFRSSFCYATFRSHATAREKERDFHRQMNVNPLGEKTLRRNHSDHINYINTEHEVWGNEVVAPKKKTHRHFVVQIAEFSEVTEFSGKASKFMGDQKTNLNDRLPGASRPKRRRDKQMVAKSFGFW
jgi:hypothetical protein